MSALKSFVITSLLLAAAFPSHSQAADPCFFISVPCDQRSSGSTVSGGAFPSFSDMFNINPASIPTIPTPVGIEAIASTAGSSSSKSDFNLALIKGFNHVGGAVSTNSDNTFYGYNLFQSYQDFLASSAAASGLPPGSVSSVLDTSTVMPTINIGGALALVFDRVQNFTIPTVGLNLRYNKTTHRWDTGFGGSINSEHLSVGLSVIHSGEALELAIPETMTTVFSLGVRYQWLSLEYTHFSFQTPDPTLAVLPLFSEPAQILTATAQLTHLSVTAAYRLSVDALGASAGLLLLTCQYQVSSHLSLALLHNYIPGSESAGAQVFF